MSSFIPPVYLPLIIVLIIINVSLASYCIYKVLKNENLSRLYKIEWGIVVICLCFLGSLIYLISISSKRDKVYQ
jgi:hypothetical protein